MKVAEAVPDEPASMIDGTEFVNVPCTTMGAVPDTPFTVTVMAATPSLIARTSPLLSTLATVGSLLAYLACAVRKSTNTGRR